MKEKGKESDVKAHFHSFDCVQLISGSKFYSDGKENRLTKDFKNIKFYLERVFHTCLQQKELYRSKEPKDDFHLQKSGIETEKRAVFEMLFVSGKCFL